MENKALATLLGGEENAILLAKKDVMKEAAQDYIKAYNSHEKKKKELQTMRKFAQDKCAEYNDALAKFHYIKWNNEGDVVLEALRAMEVPDAVRLSFKADDDDHMAYTIEKAAMEVDLPTIHATCGGDKFHDKRWAYKAEKMVYLIAQNINRKLDCPTFSYDIRLIAREFSIPAEMDPTSPSGVLLAFQDLIDSIIYIDDPKHPGQNAIHITTHDVDGVPVSKEWETIRESLTKEAGRRMVSIANTGKFINLVAREINGILTDGGHGFIVDGANIADDSAPAHAEDEEKTSDSAPAPEKKPRGKRAKKEDAAK